MRRSVLVVAGVIAVAVVAVVAYGVVNFRHNSGNGGLITVEQVNVEYRAEAQKLELPTGIRWLANSRDQEQDTRYEKGQGRADADWVWLNSWVDAAVSPRSSKAEQKEAATKLSQLYDLQLFTTMDANVKAGFRQMISQAQKGDLSGLRSYVEQQQTQVKSYGTSATGK